MNFRLTLTLSIVLLVIVGAVWVARQFPPASKPTDVGLLISPKPSAITSISFTRFGSEELKFVKQGDQWKMTVPVSANADNMQLNSIASGLQSLSFRQKFEPEPTGFHTPEATGTAKPQYLVKFSDDTKHDYTVALGKESSDSIFATLNGGKTIYLLDSNILTQLDKAPDKFRNADMKQVDSSKVVSIALVATASPATNWTLSKSDDKWLISRPVSARANANTVSEMLTELSNIRAISFPSNLSKKDAHLDPPVMTITATPQDSPPPTTTAPASAPAATAASQPATTVTLQIGYPSDLTLDKKASPVYASLAGSDEVFVLANAALKKLNLELKDIRDPAITPAAVDRATEFSLTTDGTATATATLKDNKWTLAAAPEPLAADPFSVSDYLGTVRNLRAIKFVDAAGDLKSIGLDPPHMKLEITVPGWL